jgi:hypothetical protein
MSRIKLSSIGRRQKLIAAIFSLCILLAAIIYFAESGRKDVPKHDRLLTLVTSLPLRWQENGANAKLAINAPPSPAYQRISAGRRIFLPDDLVATLNHAPIGILMLAQPRTFRGAEIFAIDKWVRRGGRLLVLADPALTWESSYPLGDKRRPQFTSMLSPLLSHWGLELFIPLDSEEGDRVLQISGNNIRTETPGAWQKVAAREPVAGDRCELKSKAFIAECQIGRGRAILVADADLLDGQYWQGTGIRALTGSDDFANIRAIEGLLDQLSQE